MTTDNYDSMKRDVSTYLQELENSSVYAETKQAYAMIALAKSVLVLAEAVHSK